jgi:hypothetical protein
MIAEVVIGTITFSAILLVIILTGSQRFPAREPEQIYYRTGNPGFPKIYPPTGVIKLKNVDASAIDTIIYHPDQSIKTMTCFHSYGGIDHIGPEKICPGIVRPVSGFLPAGSHRMRGGRSILSSAQRVSNIFLPNRRDTVAECAITSIEYNTQAACRSRA